eukprot:3412784-Rhodomonas_salina.1
MCGRLFQLEQGKLGNCYFLAAISSCGVGDSDVLIHDLIVEEGSLNMPASRCSIVSDFDASRCGRWLVRCQILPSRQMGGSPPRFAFQSA